MPVILVQVRRLNDPPQHGFLQIKGPFISYARGWAGKNGGWNTSNSGQSEGGHQLICTQRGGCLPDFPFLFYFQTNTFSALGTNGTWFARLLKANEENSHNFYEMICPNTTSRSRSSSLVLVPEEFPLLQWSTTRSRWQSLISTELLDDNTSCSWLEMFASISKLVWKKHERWFVGFYCSFYLAF